MLLHMKRPLHMLRNESSWLVGALVCAEQHTAPFLAGRPTPPTPPSPTAQRKCKWAATEQAAGLSPTLNLDDHSDNYVDLESVHARAHAVGVA